MTTRFRKAQPTAGDVHVSRPLTNISVAFAQSATNYVAADVFPTVPVMKQGDQYYIYNKEDWLRDEAKQRAPSTESAGGGFNLSTASYFAKKWAWHKDVDDDVRSNADAGINVDQDATRFVTQVLLTRREREFVANYFTPGVWTNQNTPGTLWDVSTSTPIEDVGAEIDAIQSRTGFRPNVLVVGPKVHRALKNHPDIVDRIKFTQTGIVTEELLARLFEVDRYRVARAVLNSAAEGATESTDFMFGNHALLAYANPSPSLLTPSAGYIFAWTGLLGAGAMGMRIRRFRREKLNSDRVEGELAFDMKLVSDDLAHFFNAVVS